MLVLARNVGEAIIINGNIKVTVIEVRGGWIRLGIDAPEHISVHRKEIHDRIEAEAAQEAIEASI